MVQALSTDIRQQIIEDVEGGLSRRGATRKYRVSASGVIKLVRHYTEMGSLAPRPRGGDRRSYLAPDRPLRVSLQPYELAAWSTRTTQSN